MTFFDFYIKCLAPKSKVGFYTSACVSADTYEHAETIANEITKARALEKGLVITELDIEDYRILPSQGDNMGFIFWLLE